MELMKLPHVLPAHSRTRVVLPLRISWHHCPPRYANCVSQCYLQPKLLMLFPASEGSWAAMSGVYNFCLYLVRKMEWQNFIATVSSSVADKRGKRINLPSCKLGCLFQKLVPETTTRAITIQRAVQGHWLSLAALLPALRWVISYIFPY